MQMVKRFIHSQPQELLRLPSLQGTRRPKFLWLVVAEEVGVAGKAAVAAVAASCISHRTR